MAEIVYRSATRARERILNFGPPGSGKSHITLDLLERTIGPDDTLYVVDADNAYGRLFEEAGIAVREEYVGRKRMSDFEDPDGRVVLWRANDWESQAGAIDDALARAEANDWVVIDPISVLWPNLKSWAVRQVHGTDLPDFLLQARIDAEGSGARDKGAKTQSGMLDLYDPVINPQWNNHITNPILTAECHVYVVADESSISPHAGKDVRNLYEVLGAKPEGQKRMGHNVSTVLHMVKSRVGDHAIELVKDRGREDRWNGQITVSDDGGGFTRAYLKEIAGWKVAKV